MAGKTTLATTIANLAVVLTAKTAQFSAGLSRARQKLARFGTRITAVSRKVALFSAALTAAGVAVLGLYVRRTMIAIDATAKLSDRLGIATGKLIGLAFHAELSGVKVSTLNMALQRMIRRLAEAAVGTGEAQAAIKELGLSAVALHKAGPYSALLQIVDALHQVEDRGKRLRLAFKLFDSEGVALIQMAQEGAVALVRTQELVDKLGLSLSRVDSAKIEMANDAIARAKRVAQAFWQQLTVRLAPAIKAVADWMFDLATETLKTGPIMDAVFRAVGKTILWVADAVDTVYLNFLKLQLGALEIMSQTARLLGQEKRADDLKQLAIGTRLLMDELEAKAGLAERLKVFWGDFVTQFDAAAQAIADARKQAGVAGEEGAGLGAMMEKLRRRAEALTKALRTPWEVLTDSLKEYRELLKKLPEAIFSQETYTRAVAKALEVYYKAIEKVKDSLRALADPARLRFAPATIAGTAEAVQTRWRATGGMIGAATVAVQQQQLKVQQSMDETLDKMNDILRRGLRLDDVAVLDVVM